jgi:uncharacterized protein YdhG (YjbR/CyaY superfamily)
MAESTSTSGFTAAEKAAMKERAKELKAQRTREEAEKDLLAKIAEMPAAERAIAEKIHEIVTANAPGLDPKTWYGMPGYALNGKNVIFFQPATKFDSRYSTLGFSDPAQLDEGGMWATSFAITTLSPAVEEQINTLVRKAVGG